MSANNPLRQRINAAQGARQAAPAQTATPPSPHQAHLVFEEIGSDSAVAMRFKLLTRQGQQWSYNYSYISLIELPTPQTLMISCNCKHTEVITIEGRGLDLLAHLLDLHRITIIRESIHPAYTGGPVAIKSIAVKKVT